MTVLGQRDVAADLATYHRDGFVVLPRAVGVDTLDAIRTELAPFLDESKRLGRNDFGFYPIPRPRPAISVSTVWAIDDFTTDNGATEVVPGSHHWGNETPTEDDPRIVPVEMPAGSVVVFAGTLWHRGGANQTDAPRLAITPQYCEPWARQQELQMLAVGQTAAAYSDRIRALLGYSIHPPFMGHINGLHPLRRLDDDYDPASTRITQGFR